MKRLWLLILSSVAFVVSAAENEVEIRSAAELKDAIYDHPTAGRTFEFSAQLVYVRTTPETTVWAVRDKSGSVIFSMPTRTPALCTADPGDFVTVRGRTIPARLHTVGAVLGQAFRTARGVQPKPLGVTLQDALSGRHDCQLVSVTGSVRDAFETEDNPYWEILILVSNGQVLTVSLPHANRSKSYFADLIGATVAIDGVVVPADNSPRRQLGRILTAAGPDGIRIITPAVASPDVPIIDEIQGLRPSEIAALDRHRAVGRVLATWQDDTFLVKTDSGKISRVELANDILPAVGSHVEVIGFPESDLYRINLSRARVRTLAPPAAADPMAKDLKPDDIVTTRNGRAIFKPLMHGQLVRFEGIVRSLPNTSNNASPLQVETHGLTLPVAMNQSTAVLGQLAIGCRVLVTGICVMESENWRPNAVFPRVRSVRIVLRSGEDLHVLSRPSWFTVGRLFTILGVLSGVLFAIIVWNLALRRQSEQRARKLTEESVARAESDLRVEERTRLAVELHDSVAQNLTGVAMELEAARQYEQSASPELRQHLEVAWNTLRSCRGELRNCLWGLRSRALEETDMNESIRRMLLPSVKDVTLKIRFAVPRASLLDNTVHTVLRIIRELVVNGIRHGHATEIAIAGALDDGELCFSVRDNGSGFDPATAPGVTLGHFGLEGVRERIRALGGTFEIESKPGTGAKATVRIRQHQESLSNG